MKCYTAFSSATGCQTWAIFKRMRLACGYSELSRKGLWEGLFPEGSQEPNASSGDEASQRLPALFQ